MIKRHLIVAVLLIVVASMAAVVTYPNLPERIPTHWNLRGEVDRYGSKSTVFVMPAAMIVILLLFVWVLPRISPKRFEVETFQSTYSFIALTVVGLCTYLHMAMLFWPRSNPPKGMSRVLVGGLFVFLILMGNVLGKVRRNFWIGVRTPWTLADERVWEATHRFTARLFVATGVLGLIVTLAGWPVAGLVMLALSAMVSVLYSLIYYKRLHGSDDLGGESGSAR